MTDEELKQALGSEILNFDSKNLSEEQIITIACEIGYKKIKPVALELSGNKISLKAMKYITQAVSRCPSLVYLSLIGCDLNDESIYEIVKHLCNHPLLSLLLLDNKISKYGAVALSKMLANNKHLLELNLQCNQMNQAVGIEALFISGMPFCEAAKDNCTLISFAIEANNIPSRYREAIEERVFENRKYFEEEIMPNMERLNQYKIPESLVEYLKSRVLTDRVFTLLSDPLIAIAEQQKKLQLIVETKEISKDKPTLEPLLFSSSAPTTLLLKATEATEMAPNKLADSLKTLTF